MKTLLYALVAIALSPLLYAAAPVKVDLTVSDQIRYSTKKIEAKKGTTLQITIKHTGKIPKTSMAHNIVVLKPGSSIPMVAAKCNQAKDKDYIADDADTKAAIVVHSRLLGPGESHTIQFTPSEAGEYPFFCTFPGHFGEMSGVIVVK